jgi:hypothetical protein
MHLLTGLTILTYSVYLCALFTTPSIGRRGGDSFGSWSLRWSNPDASLKNSKHETSDGMSSDVHDDWYLGLEDGIPCAYESFHPQYFLALDLDRTTRQLLYHEAFSPLPR